MELRQSRYILKYAFSVDCIFLVVEYELTHPKVEASDWNLRGLPESGSQFPQEPSSQLLNKSSGPDSCVREAEESFLPGTLQVAPLSEAPVSKIMSHRDLSPEMVLRAVEPQRC